MPGAAPTGRSTRSAVSEIPWFKVDDNLAFHAKTVAAGNAAMGMWVRAGSWCAQLLTDGFVPDHMIASLGTKAQAARLCDVRLWDREDGGYRFHEWSHEGRQPTRQETERRREEDRIRKAEARAAKAAKNQKGVQ